MRQDNQWSERAKAPDPDDLSSERPAGRAGSPDHHIGRTNIDYTAMEHHEEVPDSSDTGDISRPQGEFWHRNERPGAEAIKNVWEVEPPAEAHGEEPLKVTPEAREGTADLPTIFFVDVRHKS